MNVSIGEVDLLQQLNIYFCEEDKKGFQCFGLDCPITPVSRTIRGQSIFLRFGRLNTQLHARHCRICPGNECAEHFIEDFRW